MPPGNPHPRRPAGARPSEARGRCRYRRMRCRVRRRRYEPHPSPRGRAAPVPFYGYPQPGALCPSWVVAALRGSGYPPGQWLPSGVVAALRGTSNPRKPTNTGSGTSGHPHPGAHAPPLSPSEERGHRHCGVGGCWLDPPPVLRSTPLPRVYPPIRGAGASPLPMFVAARYGGALQSPTGIVCPSPGQYALHGYSVPFMGISTPDPRPPRHTPPPPAPHPNVPVPHTRTTPVPPITSPLATIPVPEGGLRDIVSCRVIRNLPGLQPSQSA